GFDDEGVVVTQRTRRSASLPSVTATSGCLLLSLSASPLLSWAASPPYEVIGKCEVARDERSVTRFSVPVGFGLQSLKTCA
ncbi:MAG: hypothetical protein IKR48_08140, partial [Kiritimatiellae bacterium]|nr:hypothetical protein [Kiritimatiellia bacterium]